MWWTREKIPTEIKSARQALSVRAFQLAERQFRHILSEAQDQPSLPPPLEGKIDWWIYADAHNGLGEVNIAYNDFFEANRWFLEASYLLEAHYGGHWPTHLKEKGWRREVVLRTMMGLGHIAYVNDDKKTAQSYYVAVARADKKDIFKAKEYLAGLAEGEPFASVHPYLK